MAVLVGSLGIGSAQSTPTVTLGAIYPLSGSLAAIGSELKDAVEFGAKLVNGAYPMLKSLPLAATQGLPNLGNAKLKVVFTDSQGNPSIGEADARRLITQDKVAALIGSYQSSVTKTASRPAELYGIPFLNASSSDVALTQRGFKWFFRTGPNDATFIADLFSFLDSVKTQPTQTVAVVYENTDFGTGTDALIKKYVKETGRKLVAQIPYSTNAATLSTEVQRLAAAKPDVAIFASYLSDALLFVRTMHQLGYAPPVFIANDAGFATAQFVKEDGAITTGLISRSAWAMESPQAIEVNKLFQAQYGYPLDDATSRVVQGVLVLADAINRAGSANPKAIQKALVDTHLNASQIFLPWNGVQFNKNHQNKLTHGVVVQMRGGKYVTIWVSGRTVLTPILPFSWAK